MNKRFALLTVISILVSTCSTASRPPETPILVTPDAPQVPLFVRWKPVSDEGGRTVLDAMISRRSAFASTISVRLEIPDGLTLVDGEPQFAIDGSEVGDVTRRYIFTYATAPIEDLVLIADVRGVGMGVHATDRFHFGVVEATRAAPVADGPHLILNGRDMGPSVPLPPPTP